MPDLAHGRTQTRRRMPEELDHWHPRQSQGLSVDRIGMEMADDRALDLGQTPSHELLAPKKRQRTRVVAE